MYGLGPSWLLREGQVYAESIVLSHKEQLDRLADATPAALANATVAGDPCFDRIRVSRSRRAAYREALGARDDQTVVLVSSTWGIGSLFATRPDLIGELVAELTLDEHVVAVVLHPNVWFAHGALQVRHWLGDALRAGVRLVPPYQGWQQAVVAADVAIGDHGAVTGYAAANGVPTLLAAFPTDQVARGSAIWRLGETVARLASDQPIAGQLRRAILNHDDAVAQEVAALASSEPDRAAELLRTTFYRLMSFPEPPHPALVFPYAPDALRPERASLTAVWTACEWVGDTVTVRRWPADTRAGRGRGPRTTESHLVVHDDHPRRDLRDNAAVVVGTADTLAAALGRHPSARLAAEVLAPGQCRVRDRDGRVAVFSAAFDGDPTVLASAVHTWLVFGGSWESLPRTFTLVLGATTGTARVTLSD